MNSLFPIASAFLLLSASHSGAAIVSHFSGTGVGAFAGTNAGTWGSEDVTNNSAALEFTIDYTTTVANETNPIILFDAGGSGTGAALVLNGANLHFWASNGPGYVVSGTHGLSATQTDVQIVATFELNSGTGTATNEIMSLYVNGALIGSSEFDTNNDWAGGETGSALGQESGTQRYNGTGLFDTGTVVSFPETTGIDFNLYWLASDGGPADNTISNIVVPEPSAVLLSMLGGLALLRRRRS